MGVEREVHMCRSGPYRSLPRGAVAAFSVISDLAARGTVSTKTSRVASKSGIPNLLSHTAVPTRQIRSRTFPGFRAIYRRGSNANDTKPHKSVHLYRPGTLLEQGASCFISGAKIEGMVIKFPHLFARARSSANFQQRESKATYPHLHFFLIR